MSCVNEMHAMPGSAHTQGTFGRPSRALRRQAALGPRLKTPKPRSRQPLSFGGWTFSLPGVTA